MRVTCISTHEMLAARLRKHVEPESFVQIIAIGNQGNMENVLELDSFDKLDSIVSTLQKPIAAPLEG